MTKPDTSREVAAIVTIDEHISDAVRTMKRGARMRLDGIPDDPSFLSSSYGPDVTSEIARRLDGAGAAREALLDTTASLVAAISLLEKGGRKAAWSDKVFEQMLVDYQASVDAARATLKGASQ